jgi:hypothetical protein
MYVGGGEDTYIEEISHSCPLSPSSFLSRTWFLEKLRTWGGGLDPSQYAIVLLVLQSTSAISAGSEVRESSPNIVCVRYHGGAAICGTFISTTLRSAKKYDYIIHVLAKR